MYDGNANYQYDAEHALLPGNLHFSLESQNLDGNDLDDVEHEGLVKLHTEQMVFQMVSLSQTNYHQFQYEVNLRYT